MFRPYKYKKEEVSEKPNNKGNDVWEVRIHIEPLGIDRKRLLSTVFVISGLFLITGQVIWPLLTTPRAQQPLLKPAAPEVLAGAIETERRGIKVEFEFEFTELRQENKKTPKQTLRVATGQAKKQENTPEIFYITIPKLGIEKAEVDTNSKNLKPDERLGHYAGSALPGEVGNTFIYGHSVSPMFFNPKDYKTIFTTLDKLEKGDRFTVEFGEKDLKYVVEESVVLAPEDVSPLDTIAPAFLNQSYLTLMTCVPPGLNTDRLLVQAKLIP